MARDGERLAAGNGDEAVPSARSHRKAVIASPMDALMRERRAVVSQSVTAEVSCSEGREGRGRGGLVSFLAKTPLRWSPVSGRRQIPKLVFRTRGREQLAITVMAIVAEACEFIRPRSSSRPADSREFRQAETALGQRESAWSRRRVGDPDRPRGEGRGILVQQRRSLPKA